MYYEDFLIFCFIKHINFIKWDKKTFSFTKEYQGLNKSASILILISKETNQYRIEI